MKNLRHMILAALFAALLAVGGMISIPMVPVPITLQTFVVMLAGSVLGPFWGPVSMIVFIALAAVGAPVLAGGAGGLGPLMGPTGGYIFSWILATGLIGWLVKRFWKGKVWQLALIHFIGGTLIIHAIGFPWMLMITHLPIDQAIYSALLIFLPGDVVKSIAAAIVAVAVYRAIPELKPNQSLSL